MEQTYRHPRIPEDVLNTGDFNAPNKSLSASPRLVQKITDLYGTNLPESRTRALFAASVDESNEQFIRTFHPSLEPVTQVWVFQDIDDRTVWLVSTPKTEFPLHTHMAGRPIHSFPIFQRGPPMTMADSTLPVAPDPINRIMNLRRMLTPADLSTVRRVYPGAVGIRVLLAGWIVILFRKLSDINACWRRGILATFGSRPVGFHVVDHVPTAAQPSLTYGTTVARQPNVQFAAVASVGLAITLPNGQDAITTVTHS